jgi:hypothetical protein
MSAVIKTIKVISTETKEGYIIINENDFNPKEHHLLEDSQPGITNTNKTLLLEESVVPAISQLEMSPTPISVTPEESPPINKKKKETS